MGQVIQRFNTDSYEKEDLVKLLEVSNVVVLFYDFQNPNSFLRIKNELLPLVSNFDNIYSIIIVGNKFDLLDSINQKFAADKDKEEIQTLQLEERSNIKYFAISCLNYLNISDLVYEMIDSLVNPTNILVSYEHSEEVNQSFTKNYNKNFLKALTRIFRIYDKSNSGVLTNNDFATLHREIFELQLETDDLNAIKELLKIIRQKNEMINNNNNIANIENNQIDLEGFISLNKVSVYINESQITWNILRKFGYNDELDIDNAYLAEKNFDFDPKHQHIHQLSEWTLKKLQELFNIYGVNVEDHGMLMTGKEWDKMFYPCKKPYEFEEVIKHYNFSRRSLKLNDFLFFWNCLCKISPIEAFKQFLSIGFDVNYNEFCIKTPRSSINYFQKLPFKSYQVCFIISKEEYV